MSHVWTFNEVGIVALLHRRYFINPYTFGSMALAQSS